MHTGNLGKGGRGQGVVNLNNDGKGPCGKNITGPTYGIEEQESIGTIRTEFFGKGVGKGDGRGLGKGVGKGDSRGFDHVQQKPSIWERK
jgi:hypothetical protein